MKKVVSVCTICIALFLGGCSDKQKIQDIESAIATKQTELQELKSREQELPQKIAEAEGLLETYKTTKLELKNKFDTLLGENDLIKTMVYCTLKEIDPVVSATTGYLTGDQDQLLEGLACGMASFIPGYNEISEKVTHYFDKVKAVDHQISEIEANIADYKSELSLIQSEKISILEQEIADLEKELECEQSIFCKLFGK